MVPAVVFPLDILKHPLAPRSRITSASAITAGALFILVPARKFLPDHDVPTSLLIRHVTGMSVTEIRLISRVISIS